ncbi:MAG: phosphoenolpyruvate--protein phosphotransferase [Gemmataceae bacterium]
MEIYRGIPVSAGVAIGPALVLDTEWYRIPQRTVAANRIDSEIDRLRLALRDAARDIRGQQGAIHDRLGRQYAAIFEAHALLVEDPKLVGEIESLIRVKHFAAEYAVSRVMRQYAKALEDLSHGSPLASRSADIYDIERNVLGHLLGQKREQLTRLDEAVIVLAHDLTPSETAALDPSKVHALATEAGGRASHTAIMAGALEIPAVVGLGEFATDVSGGDIVIVDGNQGLLILDPDEATLAKYEKERASFRSFETKLGELRDLPATTRDGVRITLLGNIEFPQESAHCIERGAEGVGLYRTEFLYLGKTGDPSEEDHFQAYSTVLHSLPKGQPVVIRTLDLGADKFSAAAAPAYKERNPFLGVRSVRLCLRNLGLFKTQMRAILRASALGNVQIMFPMVSTVLELRQCKMLLAEVKEDLEDEGVSFDPRLQVGTMIEVPSAALMADQLAKEVDFFSIGTNDLVQYTLAADRTNEHMASLYSPGDPAVLRLLGQVVKAGHDAKITVNVCGEMSGEPIYTLLLVGMGLRQLSVTPHNIPEVKKLIRSVATADAERVAGEAMQLQTARDVTSYLREQARRLAPDAVW